MIMIETLDKREIKIDKKEVLRYLGYGKANADQMVLDKIGAITKKMADGLSLKACYEKYPIIMMDESLCFGRIKTDSCDLKKNLSGCSDVIVFTATIGIDADRFIGKNSILSPSDAVISQAVGTAFIEKWCDILCDRFLEMENGRCLRPRFSPGYGDFSLDVQKQIISMLDAQRKIGVTLTESLLMVPSKSVSAIVGVGEDSPEHQKGGCANCKNKDCQYRRC